MTTTQAVNMLVTEARRRRMKAHMRQRRKLNPISDEAFRDQMKEAKAFELAADFLRLHKTSVSGPEKK
jgi:hypothetical protein